VGVAVLLGVVVVAMVGLPFAALAWSRAEHVRRPSPPSWTDVLHAEARRRHLTAVEVAQVVNAVNAGRAAPEDLRPVAQVAAAAKARWLSSALHPYRGTSPAALVAWVVTVLGGAAVALLLTHKVGAAIAALVVGLVIGLGVRATWAGQLRRSRRAEQLNRAAA
jgi:hypothetical protein